MLALNRSRALGLASLLYLLALAAPCLASGEANREVIDLGSRSDIRFGVDPGTGVAEIADPGNSGLFGPAAGKQIWTGKACPSTWLRFSISPGELETLLEGHRTEKPLPRVQWVLVVQPSFSIILDHVDLFIPLGDGSFERIASGALSPRRPFEAPSRSFIFELPAEAFEGRPCYLRLSSARDVEARILLEPALARDEGLSYAAYGVIYGILIAMMLYGLFILVSLGDKAYFHYILYTLSSGLWLFFVQGHAKALFGQHPGFDQAMLWFFAGALMTWASFFSAIFLELRKGKPVLFLIFMAVALLGILSSAAGLAGLQDLAFAVSHYLGMVLPLVIIVAGVIRTREGFPAARYFLLGWSMLALGGLAFSLMGLKILPVNFWTVNSMGIGFAAESIFLALALADRFKRVETEKKRLERSQAQYQELSLTDVLTGLRNKRCLSIQLNEAMANSREKGDPLSLIFLDLDDFKDINDSYGHAIGDEVLAALARSIRSCVRDDDIPCRYGGEEFVIVMPGARSQDAFNVAERIRENFAATGSRAVDGAAVGTTVSLGVTEFRPGDSAEVFITRADDAMYEAKRLGKNRSVAR